MLDTIVLADNLGKGIRIARRLGSVNGIAPAVLVARDVDTPAARFFLHQVGQFLQLDSRSKRLTVRLRLRGRLRLTVRLLQTPRNLAWLRRRRPDVGLHAAGVIYRRPILECFRLGVLNAHIGILPAYRGRSVMEWSILEGQPTGVTAFFVDEGIDTGEHIVLRRSVDVGRFRDSRSAKRHLFSLDADVFAEAIQALQAPGYAPIVQRRDEGRRYYVMSRLFREVVDGLLEAGVETTTGSRALQPREKG